MAYKVWPLAGLRGVEASAYRGKNQVFPTSLVTEFNFGVRLAGVREMTYRRSRFTTGPGTLHAFAPGVALTAKPVSGEVWQYADVCFTEAGLERLLGEQVPDFSTLGLTGAVESSRNDALRERFLLSHTAITARAPRLEQETKLLAWLYPLFAGSPAEEKLGREPETVRLVRDYLDAYATREVSLDELAALVELNKHYLLRVFLSEVGLTPYKYQLGLRLSKAQLLLQQGMRPAQVAAELGFYDQSALNRLFKRHMFLTPGQYQQAALENRSLG